MPGRKTCCFACLHRNINCHSYTLYGMLHIKLREKSNTMRIKKKNQQHHHHQMHHIHRQLVLASWLLAYEPNIAQCANAHVRRCYDATCAQVNGTHTHTHNEQKIDFFLVIYLYNEHGSRNRKLVQQRTMQ